jgi:hypothetical protein
MPTHISTPIFYPVLLPPKLCRTTTAPGENFSECHVPKRLVWRFSFQNRFLFSLYIALSIIS